MNKKTGNWFRDNMFNLIIASLLGIIAWGGKLFIDNQLIFQSEQRELNQEFIKTNVAYQEKCFVFDEKIFLNSTVNMNQGVKILKNTERSIKNETNVDFIIENLKD